MYKIFLKKGAQKALLSLPKKEISVITDKIKNLVDNPHPPQSKKLIGSSHNYRLRKGNYRILYTIDDKEQKVTIYRISHRKDAY